MSSTACQPKLALDFDSTLWPILPAMGLSYDDCPSYQHLPVLCGGVPQMIAAFDAVMDYEAMARTPLFDGAAASVQRLASAGAEVHIMTARPLQYREAVERILREAHVPFVQVDCAPDIDKISLCLERGIGVLVDDHPQTLQLAHQAGITVLTLGYAYNQQACTQLGITAATDWQQLEAQIAAALGLAAGENAAVPVR